MKVIICLSFLACCAFVFGKPSDDHYTTKYDNIDIDAIIKNDRLLRAYVDCLKGTKKCNKDGEELKSKFFIFINRMITTTLNNIYILFWLFIIKTYTLTIPGCYI